MERKKEQCSRQKLRVDVRSEHDGTLLLANPMAGGDFSGPRELTNSADHFHPRAHLPRKRSSLKSPSLLRLFVRGRKPSEDVEESSTGGDDMEDGLSAIDTDVVDIHGLCYTTDTCCCLSWCPRIPFSLSNSQCSLPECQLSSSPSDTSSFRFSRSLAAYATLPRRREKKRNSGLHLEQADDKSQEHESLSPSHKDSHPNTPTFSKDEKFVGMEALEALQNQIHILLKQDCPEEDTQLTTLHDVVIASLRHQLDEMQQTLDFLRASDQSLRLALRVSDMRVQETEVELSKAIERNKRLEQSLLTMAQKCQQLESLPSKHSHFKSQDTQFYSPQFQRVQRRTNTTGLVADRGTQPTVHARPSSAMDTRDTLSSVQTYV